MSFITKLFTALLFATLATTLCAAPGLKTDNILPNATVIGYANNALLKGTFLGNLVDKYEKELGNRNNLLLQDDKELQELLNSIPVQAQKESIAHISMDLNRVDIKAEEFDAEKLDVLAVFESPVSITDYYTSSLDQLVKESAGDKDAYIKKGSINGLNAYNLFVVEDPTLRISSAIAKDGKQVFAGTTEALKTYLNGKKAALSAATKAAIATMNPNAPFCLTAILTPQIRELLKAQVANSENPTLKATVPALKGATITVTSDATSITITLAAHFDTTDAASTATGFLAYQGIPMAQGMVPMLLGGQQPPLLKTLTAKQDKQSAILSLKIVQQDLDILKPIIKAAIKESLGAPAYQQ